MGQKNYYAILGVSRTESSVGIRAAFRKLAKIHHPDVSGHEKTRSFQEITEAYCVLSDPDSRECHDRALKEEEARESRGAELGHTILRGSRFPAWRSHRRMSGLSVPDILDGLFADLFQSHFRTSVPSVYDIEVILDTEEASRGVDLPLTISMQVHCPACGGSGERGPFMCLRCHGRGALEAHESIRINLPPKTEHGSVIDIPVRKTGTETHVLRLHIRVEDYS